MGKIIEAADLFCGAGGISTGLGMAVDYFGKDLNLVAVNHWERAIETHAANHPLANHFCTGIGELKPSKAVPGGKLDLLVASPECTHHSIARGGKPFDDQGRSSAWHVLHWCQELYVRNIIMENVPEFTNWGPLGENKKPLKSKKGQTFLAFLNALKSLGYSVDWRILTCADYGDATTRKRFFLMAHRGNRRIKWPEPTHFQIAGKDIFENDQKSWVPAKDIIDWTIPGHSLFLTPEDVKKHNLRIKRPLVPNTIKRIESGIKKYWGDWAEPFLVMLYGSNNTRSIDRPLHHYLVDPFIVKYYGHGKGSVGVDSPIDTITTNDTFGLVRPMLIQIGEEKYLLDILFRMLTPKELAAAHSFPEDYRFAGNKTEIVKQIGNSVPVKISEQLCRSQLAA